MSALSKPIPPSKRNPDTALRCVLSLPQYDSYLTDINMFPGALRVGSLRESDVNREMLSHLVIPIDDRLGRSGSLSDFIDGYQTDLDARAR